MGYVEGCRGASGGVVPRDGEGDVTIHCGGAVSVASFCCGGNRIGRAGGLGSEGWLGGGGVGCDGWIVLAGVNGDSAAIWFGVI